MTTRHDINIHDAEERTVEQIEREIDACAALALSRGLDATAELEVLRTRLRRRRAQDAQESNDIAFYAGHDLSGMPEESRAQILSLRHQQRAARLQSHEASRQEWRKRGGVQVLASEAFDVNAEIVIDESHASRMVRSRRGDEPFDGTALQASSGPGVRVWIAFRRRREMQG